LAVVEADREKHAVGVLSEAHAMCRYTEESERRRNVMDEV
jgi:hypothetical protein